MYINFMYTDDVSLFDRNTLYVYNMLHIYVTI